MKRLLQSVVRALSERHAKSRAPRYARHPEVITLGASLFSAEGSREPVVLNEVGRFIWKHLGAPRTKEELVSAVTHEFSVDVDKAASDIQSFLNELSTKGLIVNKTRSDEAVVNAARPSQSAALLAAAYDRQEAEDWQGALSLCVKASHEAEYPEIVELNILICRFHLGAAPGHAEQALSLAPKLPVAARIACWGLAMASAHREGDLRTTKAIACELARHVPNPWDLPTVPKCVYRVGEKVMVMETRAVESFEQMIRSVQTQCVNTPDEAALLAVLAQRYRERRGA